MSRRRSRPEHSKKPPRRAALGLPGGSKNRKRTAAGAALFLQRRGRCVTGLCQRRESCFGAAFPARPAQRRYPARAPCAHALCPKRRTRCRGLRAGRFRGADPVQISGRRQSRAAAWPIQTWWLAAFARASPGRSQPFHQHIAAPPGAWRVASTQLWSPVMAAMAAFWMGKNMPKSRLLFKKRQALDNGAAAHAKPAARAGQPIGFGEGVELHPPPPWRRDRPKSCRRKRRQTPTPNRRYRAKR